jgi:hypothetical protein
MLHTDIHWIWGNGQKQQLKVYWMRYPYWFESLLTCIQHLCMICREWTYLGRSIGNKSLGWIRSVCLPCHIATRRLETQNHSRRDNSKMRLGWLLHEACMKNPNMLTRVLSYSEIVKSVEVVWLWFSDEDLNRIIKNLVFEWVWFISESMNSIPDSFTSYDLKYLSKIGLLHHFHRDSLVKQSFACTPVHETHSHYSSTHLYKPRLYSVREDPWNWHKEHLSVRV